MTNYTWKIKLYKRSARFNSIATLWVYIAHALHSQSQDKYTMIRTNFNIIQEYMYYKPICKVKMISNLIKRIKLNIISVHFQTSPHQATTPTEVVGSSWGCVTCRTNPLSSLIKPHIIPSPGPTRWVQLSPCPDHNSIKELVGPSPVTQNQIKCQTVRGWLTGQCSSTTWKMSWVQITFTPLQSHR